MPYSPRLIAATGILIFAFLGAIQALYGPLLPALQRTFGVDNPSTVTQFRTGTGRTNSYARVGPIVISEIHYHPVAPLTLVENPDEEFIEVNNTAATSTPLFDPANPSNTWRLRGYTQKDVQAIADKTLLAGLAGAPALPFDGVANLEK